MKVERNLSNTTFRRPLESLLKGRKFIGNPLIIRGINLSDEMVVFLTNLLSNHNIKVIKIDPEIPYYELENLFRDKDKLQERLRIEGNTLKVLRQLTPDEARQEVQNGFLLSANEGVKKYLSYQKILTPWQAKEIFSQHLKTVASLFKEEGVNESEFEKLLEVLDNLSDQKLNQDWIKELLNTKEHDESWASLALEYFRKKYPQELWFHKTAAEFNFKLGVYDYAREAYQAALDLKPNDKQLKEMVKRCERMLRQQKEEVQKRIIQEFNQIWNNLIQNRNFESAKVLLDKFPSATLAELLKNKIPPRYEPLNKVYHALKILKETAEQTKNYSLLSLLDHYQLQLLSDLFEHVVKGHVINQEMLEVLRIIVESDEFVVPSLMPKIEKTLTTDDHRNKELCSFIMNYLFSRHLLNGHKLFQEGQVKEAMSEFDLALEAYPDSSLALAEKGSAYLVLGQVEPAEELLEKALKYDPNNFIALDRLIWIGISKNDLHKVIELAMRVLAGEEREGWEKIRKVARKTALLNLPYAYLRLWDESQEENLLESAQKYALQLQVEYPQEKKSLYYLAQIHFARKEVKEALDFADQYFKDPELNFEDIFVIFYPLWPIYHELSDENQHSLKDFFLQFEEKVLRKALPQENLATKIIDFAIDLGEAGIDDIAERLIAFYLERGKKDQAFFQALYVQAFLHYQLGEFSQAEQQLLRIVGDRNHSEVCLHAYNLLAQVYREISSQQNNSHKRREILNRGKKILAKAILEYPNHPILLNTMGVIYDELGNKARAKEYFVAAQAADPFCLFSYLNLVDLQLDYQRKEEAEVELQKLQVKIKEMLENRQHMPEILKIDFYVFMKEIIQRTQSRAAQEILESIFSSPYGGKARKLFQMAKGPIQSNS